ncbi:MAG: insulinase family protein [Endomicrobium sp.]|jgi:predicted Zn-dependent peptidase|nr:insulinase family protein [Endomicrobium sp.]
MDKDKNNTDFIVNRNKKVEKALMKSFVLKNNIKVVFNKTCGAKVVSIRVLTPVSVIAENLCNAGISYLTSKLMTYSSRNYSYKNLAKAVEDIGAELVGDADYDLAEISMSFLSHYFDNAVEILSEVILNPEFDEKELSFEKQIIVASLNSRKDSIGSTALDNFIKIFYDNNAYSNPVLGVKDTILKITRNDLIKWHKYSYNASNILISVAGNIDEEVVEESLKKHFSTVTYGAKFEKPIFSLKHSENIKKEIKGKFNQAYICIGFPAHKLDSKKNMVVKVISAILGGRMTSRLFVELREKLGLAYEVSTMYPLRKQDSFLAIYIGLDKKNIELTLKRIDEILKDFCTVKISSQELKNTKTYIKGIYAMSRQTVSKQSFYYGWLEIVGKGCQYEEQYLKELDMVTAEDLIDVANKMFSQKSITVVVNPK